MEIPLPILVAGITHDGNYGTLTKRSQREEAERLGRTVNRHLSCRSRVAFCYELVIGFPSLLTRPSASPTPAPHPAKKKKKTVEGEGQKADTPPRQQGDLTLHASAVHSLSCYATSHCY